MPKNTGRQSLPPGWRPFQEQKRSGGLFGRRPSLCRRFRAWLTGQHEQEQR